MGSAKAINTESVSASYRSKAIDLTNKRILITNFLDTEQEKDLTTPPNCNGFGRIRHFRRQTSDGWPVNPLPIDPASKALGLSHSDMIRAQVFQNAVCNWRCFYCFVPFSLLSANSKYSDWLSASELMGLYLEQSTPPSIIDLTGGQPDLVPEWLVWMMQEITDRKLEEKVYLWSDDNLSTDYFWKYLSSHEIDLIQNYEAYGRVCCFKGFNESSFAFNTLAEPSLFFQQFELMKRLLSLNLDLYCYVTFTTPSPKYIERDMSDFIDRLQELDEQLPLRTIPLEIQVFTPVEKRLKGIHKTALNNQQIAVRAWQAELEQRFSQEERTLNITAIKLRSRQRYS